MATLTGFKTDRVGAYIEKDPFAVLDYSLDFTDWMPAGDTINTISVSADSGITVDSTSKTDYVATATLSGGTAGTIYNIEYRITTTNALQDSRNIRIKVLERQA
jgi:hypothetical protein|tara:strand:- start:20 stop:331 length:312 start_codon:yes stop_codon:yes gene_type:complete